MSQPSKTTLTIDKGSYIYYLFENMQDPMPKHPERNFRVNAIYDKKTKETIIEARFQNDDLPF